MTDNYAIQVRNAGRTFGTLDYAAIASMYHLEYHDGCLYPMFPNETYQITPVDAVVTRVSDGARAPFGAAMSFYDHYSRRPSYLTGKWFAQSSMNAVKGGSLSGRLEASDDRNGAFFSGKMDLLKKACAVCGGTAADGADFSCVLPVFSDFPVLLRFYDADDEFPAQLQFLWDHNTPAFLTYETTWYTVGAILTRLHEAAAE